MTNTDVDTELGPLPIIGVSGGGTVLHQIMTMLEVSDIDLAVALGVSRQTIHKRRKGTRSMTGDDMKATAEALGVDPRLFMGTRLEAIDWIREHRAELFEVGEVTGALAA